LAVGEILDELKDGDQRQPPWTLGWLASPGKKVSQISILHE
jgi:hypothetical protein